MNSKFRQELVFGLMMTVGMVTIMLAYNGIWALGFTSEALLFVVTQFVSIFVVAFVVEQLVVSHNAQRLHKVVAKPTDPYFKNVLKFSVIMVTGMCVTMSLYATLVQVGTGPHFWSAYGEALLRNYPVALIAQLAIVGPLTRVLHGKIFQPAHSKAEA